MKRLDVVLVCIMVAVFSLFGAYVSGRATDELGAPYPGLTIYLSGDSYYESTSTAMSGNFIFAGVEPGYYTLYPDYSVITTPWDYEVYVATSTDSLTGYDFSVRTPPTPDAMISGYITFEGGTPAPSVEVYAWSESSPFDYDTYTDASGYFFFELPGGYTYEMSCWLYGYVSDPAEHIITIASGDTLTGFDFVLNPPPPVDAFVSGNVTYSDGSPAPWAEIYAFGFTLGFSYNTYTDASGSYTIGLPSGDSYDIYCWSSGSSYSVPEEYSVYLTSGDSLIGYDFVLYSDTIPDEMMIEAWVTDCYGNPMIAVPVSFTADTGGPATIINTDFDGYAYFYTYAPGYYIVEPSMDGIVFTPTSERVYVDFTDPYNYVSFSGDSGPTIDYGIEVVAMDSAFAGVESLFVEWRPIGGTWSLAVTNDSGYAYIALPAAGTYNVRAIHPNPLALIIPCSLNVTVDDTENVAWVTFIVRFLDGIDEVSRPEQPGIALSPNPFNSTTRIIASGGANIDEIEVFDISGRLIHRESLGPKRLNYDWTAPEGLPAGVYFFRIHSAEKTFTAKAVFAK